MVCLLPPKPSWLTSPPVYSCARLTCPLLISQYGDREHFSQSSSGGCDCIRRASILQQRLPSCNQPSATHHFPCTSSLFVVSTLFWQLLLASGIGTEHELSSNKELRLGLLRTQGCEWGFRYIRTRFARTPSVCGGSEQAIGLLSTRKPCKFGELGRSVLALVNPLPYKGAHPLYVNECREIAG